MVHWTIHTTNRPRQSKFTMLFALNHIKETMYYWGDNYKMQTSHTLCSRPKRYGALQVKRVQDHGDLCVGAINSFARRARPRGCANQSLSALTALERQKGGPKNLSQKTGLILCNHDSKASPPAVSYTHLTLPTICSV